MSCLQLPGRAPPSGEPPGEPEQATAPINMIMPRPPSMSSMRRAGSSHSFLGTLFPGGHTGGYAAGHTGGRSSTNPIHDGNRNYSTDDDDAATAGTINYYSPPPFTVDGGPAVGSSHTQDSSRAAAALLDPRPPKIFLENENFHASYTRQVSDPTAAGRTAGIPTFAPPTEASSPGRKRGHQTGFQSFDVSQTLGSSYDPHMGVSGSSRKGLSGARFGEDASGPDLGASSAVAPTRLSPTHAGMQRNAADFMMTSGALCIPALVWQLALIRVRAP